MSLLKGWLARLPLALALGVTAAALLVPLGAMLWSSLRVERIVAQDGRVITPQGSVRELRGGLHFWLQAEPGAERTPTVLRLSEVRERRTDFGWDHYRFVWGDPRTLPLLRTSLTLAGGAAAIALLLGWPAAWALTRVRLPGRRLFAVAAVAPLLLPPLVVGMGAARPYGEALTRCFGLHGRALELATAMLVLGATLAPVVILLLGRALSTVPAGPYEAARLLRGPRAAWRVAVLPHLVPALVGASCFAVLLALADFTVPDLMTFLLPESGTPLAVFAKDVQLQWKQEQNQARAVATGAPLMLLCLVALALAAFALRRGPLVAAVRTGRCLEPRRLGLSATLGAVVLALLPFLLGLVFPLLGVLSWAGEGGRSVARGSAAVGADAPILAPRRTATLGDLSGTLEATPGSREQRDRWLRTGAAAALLCAGVAGVLARWVTRGGRGARVTVAAIAGLSLAAPGLVVGLGTLSLWLDLGLDPGSLLCSALALTARFLPYALWAALLALREVRPGYEEAAATLGASATTRFTSVVLPLAGPGLFLGALLAFVLALREVDAVVLLETRLFPLLIYNKIHYSQYADEANLVLLYLLWLLIPALILALAAGWLARRRGAQDLRSG